MPAEYKERRDTRLRVLDRMHYAVACGIPSSEIDTVLGTVIQATEAVLANSELGVQERESTLHELCTTAAELLKKLIGERSHLLPWEIGQWRNTGKLSPIRHPHIRACGTCGGSLASVREPQPEDDKLIDELAWQKAKAIAKMAVQFM